MSWGMSRTLGFSAMSLGALALVASSGLGQQAGDSSALQRRRAPYTAEFRTTTVRILTDGTTITRQTKQVEAVDSRGRTLRLTSNVPTTDGQPENVFGMVRDPADWSNTTWPSGSRQAIVQKMPPPDQRHGCWANDAGTARANYDPPDRAQLPQVANLDRVRPVIDDLGTDTIDGIPVQGRRITTTIEAGRIGNNNPIVTTNEMWTAPSLGGLTLRSESNDPQSGKTTRELVSLKVGEPDPAIFQPPSDYKVIVQEMHQVPCETLPHGGQ